MNQESNFGQTDAALSVGCKNWCCIGFNRCFAFMVVFVAMTGLVGCNGEGRAIEPSSLPTEAVDQQVQAVKAADEAREESKRIMDEVKSNPPTVASTQSSITVSTNLDDVDAKILKEE